MDRFQQNICMHKFFHLHGGVALRKPAAWVLREALSVVLVQMLVDKGQRRPVPLFTPSYA